MKTLSLKIGFAISVFAASVVAPNCESQTLRVITLNMWTGLDYHGVFAIGEYESPDVRERRMQMVEKMIGEEHPDVVALQEVNPVHGIASRLADHCGYDFIDQRVNSGLKVGPLGFPWNLNEGLVILARKGLHLEFVDVWVLSNTSGLIGNGLSLHSTEHDVALVGKVLVDNVPVFVVNTHTIAAVPVDSLNTAVLNRIVETKNLDRNDRQKVFAAYQNRVESIRHEVKELSDHLNAFQRGAPLIVMGDFNLGSQSQEMKNLLDDANLFDAAECAGQDTLNTWNADRNTNISYSRKEIDARAEHLSPLDLLSASYDGRSRRIDYVLLNQAFSRKDLKLTATVLDHPEGGLYASDHFGVLAEISVASLLLNRSAETKGVVLQEEVTVEPFPIASYDTDVGFGYGAKLFLLNSLGRSESFDMVLFNSTKGERWYRFVFSIPDFELRQGKVYPFALDFVVDYDKYLRNSFFGVGSRSRFSDREYYTREPLEVGMTVSRGISEHVVVQAGVRYKSVRNFNFSDTSHLRQISPSLHSGEARYHSFFASYRFDTRDSFINPSRGWVVLAEGEYAPGSNLTNVQLGRVAGWIQYYSTLFYPKSVLALRMGIQGLIGNDLPVQALLPIGGNQTLRGSPQDRYLDKASAILNAELRFPIYWRFGGVVGYDAGRVWNSSADLDLKRWASNSVLGLRFFMETFVVRMDFGFGSETTGFFINFGHLF